MSSIYKKNFDSRELKWGAIKRYDGTGDNKAELTFCSYVIFFVDKNGSKRNAVNQDEYYDDIQSFMPFSADKVKQKKNGKEYIETISDSASFILYRAFDINKKKKFTIKDIEDAIMSCDMLFFKDREKIEQKRNVGYQKVKKL